VHAFDFKEIARLVTKQQNYLNFGRKKTLLKPIITFISRIVDGHIEFPYCMLLFKKSNQQMQLEITVT